LQNVAPACTFTLTLARHSHEHTPALTTRALTPVVRAEINRPQS